MQDGGVAETVSLDRVVLVLNEAAKLDPAAMAALVHARVPCNEALADHPTIGVVTEDGKPYKVGFLGVLNGLFGVYPDGNAPIAAMFKVECPNGEVDHGGRELPLDARVGQPCPTCGATLVLGELIEFRRMRPAENTDGGTPEGME